LNRRWELASARLKDIGLFLMFYLTPIFWEPGIIPEPYRRLFLMNPFAALLTAYRDILMRAMWPDARSLVLIGCLSSIVLWVGYELYDRARLRFVEEI
jgi:ABC-type polysaccharide/polyol phosphate export permease